MEGLKYTDATILREFQAEPYGSDFKYSSLPPRRGRVQLALDLSRITPDGRVDTAEGW